MSTPDPSISVLMPNYNNGHLIANALESVCTQDYAPIEVLITDDCSTDNSLEVIQRYADRYSFVRIVRYPEKSKDWLRKHYEYWRTARGDYVMSLASDDIIYPGLLRKAAELIRQHPGVGVVFPDIRILFPDYSHFKYVRSGLSEATCLQGDPVVQQVCKPFISETGSGSIIRKDAIAELLDEPSIYATEHLLDMLAYPIVAVRHGACYIPEALAGFRFSPGQLSGNILIPEVHFRCCEAARNFLNLPAIRKDVPAAVTQSLHSKALCIRPAGVTANFAVRWNRFMLPRVLSQRKFVRWLARLTYRGMDKLNDTIQFLRYGLLR